MCYSAHGRRTSSCSAPDWARRRRGLMLCCVNIHSTLWGYQRTRCRVTEAGQSVKWRLGRTFRKKKFTHQNGDYVEIEQYGGLDWVLSEFPITSGIAGLFKSERN